MSYLFVIILIPSCAQRTDNQVEESTAVTFEPELMVDGLEIPWGIAFLPDGSMLVTEKSGTLYRVTDGNKNAVTGIPKVYQQGQGGLMDVALDPSYGQNGLIYLTYASDSGDGEGGNTALIRGRFNNNSLENVETLYKAVPNTTSGRHYGSRITFDDAGFLYFSIGERGFQDVNPQDLTRDGGKIYRLNTDGSIPADNPFVGQQGAKTAIYSYGNRNAQGLVKNPFTGEIWEHEHGPKGGDEINIIKKGANYGWPVVTYGIDYNGTPISDNTEAPGIENPIHYWVPSIAPSGMVFVTSDKYPGWQGNLLVGSLSFQYLERLVLDSNNKVTKREKLLDDIGRVRDVEEGPDGLIYVAVEGKGIYRLVPKN